MEAAFWKIISESSKAGAIPQNGASRPRFHSGIPPCLAIYSQPHHCAFLAQSFPPTLDIPRSSDLGSFLSTFPVNWSLWILHLTTIKPLPATWDVAQSTSLQTVHCCFAKYICSILSQLSQNHIVNISISLRLFALFYISICHDSCWLSKIFNLSTLSPLS